MDLQYKYIEYEKDTFIAKYYQKKSKYIIITFMYKDENVDEYKNQPGWGVEALLKEDISILAIIPKYNNWYRGDDLHDFFESKLVVNIFKKYTRHLFVGASMGGYGALVFSSIIKDSEVLAFNPQSTLDTDIIPLKLIRDKSSLNENWKSRYSDANKLYLNKVFIIYDNYNTIDKMHADRIIGKEIVHLKYNNVGHKIPEKLQEAKILKPIMKMFVDGKLNQESFNKLKDARKKFKNYQTNILDYLLKNKQYDKAIELSLRFGKTHDLADGFRDTAIHLEDEDVHTSLKLMQHASNIRPRGPLIQKKIILYKNIIKTNS
jgi:hypothetical protein